MNPPGSDFPIDILCLSAPEASELRALFDEWRSAYDPASPIERALLEQAVLALFEKRRLLRLRATLQTERGPAPRSCTGCKRSMMRLTGRYSCSIAIAAQPRTPWNDRR